MYGGRRRFYVCDPGGGRLKLTELITKLEAIKSQLGDGDPLVRIELNGPVYSQGAHLYVAEPRYDREGHVILAVEE